MTLIQNTLTCASLPASSAAASVASLAGRGVQHVMDAGRSFSSGVQFLANKCAAAAVAVFNGATMYANMGWQVAKYLGARGWEAAKIGGNYSLDKASLLFSKIASGGSYALGAAAQGTQATCSAMKCGALKAGAFSLEKINQFGSFLKQVAVAGGTGALHGLQITRNFAAAHPKEICLVGAALTIGLAIGYATAHVLNSPADVV